jgi:hypoxanthine phosphoribosyltransferase
MPLAETGPTADDPTVPTPASPPGGPNFAHASEAEMGRILDFYAVRWEYEPTVFPILWNLEGAVVESFAPDFFLPDFDLYLEMTTLRQKLVRKKNRKLRRLRELYPDIRIKLFYARDFRELMLKYGKLGLHGALSGTSGQAGPNGLLPTAASSPNVTPSATVEPSPTVEPSATVEPSPTGAPAVRRSRPSRETPAAAANLEARR